MLEMLFLIAKKQFESDNMKSVIIVLSLSVILSVNSFSQNPTSQVIASAGDEYKNSEYLVSWTLGEAFTETIGNNDNNLTLTQGFHQTKLIVTSIGEIANIAISVTAYPNPTNDIVFLKVETTNYKGFEYIVYNTTGSVNIQKNISSSIEQIDFRNLTSGAFILQILQNKKLIETFKIINQ